MYLTIAGIHIEINTIYRSDLEPLFLPYQSDHKPDYKIDCLLIDSIKRIEDEHFMSDKNRYFYQIGDETVLQVLNNEGLVKYQIKHTKDYKVQEILFVDGLNKTKSDMAYILISMCFLEVSNREGFLALHASAIILNHEAILFSAPSKTGKSTHVNHYIETFKDVLILNDDKPLIKNGFVYGSPFSGKTFKNINAKYPLKAICFIHQAPKTSVYPIDEDKAIKQILKNMLRPSDKHTWDNLVLIINELLTYPIYEAGLTIDKSSVYETYYHIYKEQTMKLKTGFTLKEIGSKTIIVPVDENALTFNGILTINKSARVLFEALFTEQTIESLTNLLLDKYDIDPATAKKDVITFVDILKEKDLLL